MACRLPACSAVLAIPPTMVMMPTRAITTARTNKANPGIGPHLAPINNDEATISTAIEISDKGQLMTRLFTAGGK